MAAQPSPAAGTSTASSQRLASLDAFRGLTVASMIFVSSLGDSGVVPTQLQHVAWHGATFRDLISPFFLFAMGLAMAFALARYLDGREDRVPWARIVRRSATLVVIGLALNFVLYELPDPDFSDFRIMGVLQRIGLAYLLTASLVLLVRSVRLQAIIGAACLLAYGLALAYVPVPGVGAGVLTPEGNLPAYVDAAVLGEQHLHRGGPFDPEGLLATLPSVVTVLLGWWTGRLLAQRPTSGRVAVLLAGAGLAAVALGVGLGQVQPINKALWTPAFVVVSAGWAWVTLAALYALVELAGWRRLGWSFEVFGRNALFAFTVPRAVAHVLDLWHIGPDGQGAFTAAYERTVLVTVGPWLGEAAASIAFGLLVTGLWWIVHYAMYRRGWFLRL